MAFTSSIVFREITRYAPLRLIIVLYIYFDVYTIHFILAYYRFHTYIYVRNNIASTMTGIIIIATFTRQKNSLGHNILFT